MTEFLIQVRFANLDLESEETLEALADAGLLTAEPLDSGLCLLNASVEARNAVRAAIRLVDEIASRVPMAVPLQMDRDLVSVSDIAERIGLTREAVRNWASGKRRSGSFPSPVGTPSGSQVWEWTVVRHWLRENLKIESGLELPTSIEYSQIDAWLEHRRHARSGAAVASLTEASVWRRIDTGSDTMALTADRQVIRPADVRWIDHSEKTSVDTPHVSKLEHAG